MKILMLSDRLALGGAETHIYELTKELHRRGHTVVLCAGGGVYAEKMQQEGFAYIPLPFVGGIADTALAYRTLARVVQKGQFDIVHAHARRPACMAHGICKRYGVPFVTTAHWVFAPHGWRGALSRWGAHTFAVSPDIKTYLQTEYAIAPQNITVIRNGIDTDRFAPKPHPPGGHLLHISRLDRGRAACAYALLRIAGRLAKEGGCRTLTVVGNGDVYPELAEKAERINHALGFPFVHMAGGQTDIRPYLWEADGFVGVSRAALEAMAAGLPCVLCGDEGYLGRISPDNAHRAEEGNFCCRGSSPMADGTLFCDIRDMMQSRPSGVFGRSFVQEKYSVTAMADAVLEGYRRACLPHVTVCGYYGAGNTGDEAVLAQLQAKLSKEGFAPPTVISRRLRAKLPRGGVFILGGGNLLQNETSNRSLLYYTHMMKRAKAAGCRTVLLGGIGKLNKHGEQVASRALQKTDGFLMRTPNDCDTARRLLKSDKPMALLPDGGLWVTGKEQDDRQRDVLLLALHGADKRAPALAEWGVKQGLRVALAIMQTDADEAVAREVAMRVPGCLLWGVREAEAWVTALGACRLVYATRLHMLIFAACAGVPAITPSDSGKIAAFADYAAQCGGEHFLVCLPHGATAGECIGEAERILALPYSEEEAKSYLFKLQAAGEAFSFSRFFEGLA